MGANLPTEQNKKYSEIVTKESTEKGDIAKSLQQLVQTQFVSKRFKDVFGSTRLTKPEVYIFAIMETQRIMCKILSISEFDMESTNLNKLPKEEQADLKELWELRQRYDITSFAFGFTIYDAFMSMTGLALQSLDGLSRQEGTQLVGGTYQKIMNPNEMGFFDKALRRIKGNVLYPEEA